MKVQVKDVRGAFLSLFEAKAVGDGEPTFSGAFPIEPGSANAKLLSQALVTVANEKWKDKGPAILKELQAKGRVGYKEAPLSKDGEVYDGFEGMYSLNASSSARPLVIDQLKNPLTAQDGKPYSGCYLNVSVEVWAQDNKYGKRVNCQLKGVQFVRDGDSFGGGTPASPDDFDAITEGATADDLV